MPSSRLRTESKRAACEGAQTVRTIDRGRYRGMGGSQPTAAARGVDWLPPVDIVETPTDFEVALSISGVPREEIDVHLEHDRLTVSGTRKAAAQGELCHYRERPVGRFFRAFSFRTPVDADGIQAKLANGVLRLRIPKQLPRNVELE
jgi:HSP20 family protein